MDKPTLQSLTDYVRNRLLGSLDSIEKSGHDVSKVLAFRPGPNRAHLGWQFMHCAATHDKYVNVYFRGGEPFEPLQLTSFGGGSTPTDDNVPSASAIREYLGRTLSNLKSAIESEDLARTYTLPNGTVRNIGDSVMLLAWHESHHQGQIHLTWNLYQASMGLKK
jgi:hypothetical protein